MKALVAFSTRKGASREMAERIAATLGEETDVIDLKRRRAPSPEAYDAVVLGGSIMAGQVPRKLRAYAARHADALAEKRLGLFVCSLREDEAENVISANFGEPLAAAATATAWLGGRIIMSEHGPVVRAMLRKVMETDEDVVNLRFEEADRFARKLASEQTEAASAPSVVSTPTEATP
ncbi:MAG: flavodoxin domain-containing protein [bacterium]